jgi:hypothetical protein
MDHIVNESLEIIIQLDPRDAEKVEKERNVRTICDNRKKIQKIRPKSIRFKNTALAMHRHNITQFREKLGGVDCFLTINPTNRKFHS